MGDENPRQVITGLKPGEVQTIDPEAWREWNALCDLASAKGYLVSEYANREDYPGPDEGWQAIVETDRRLRQLRSEAKQRRASGQSWDEQERSSVPRPLRNHLTNLDDIDVVLTAVQWVSDWHAGRVEKGLLLLGPVGVGKSTVAGAVAVDCGEPTLARYLETRVLVNDQLQFWREQGQGPSPLDKAVDKTLLVLDDLGVERDMDVARDVVAELVERRHARRHEQTRSGKPRSMVVTANLVYDEVVKRYGERIASRLMELTRPVPIGGQDRRRS